MANDTIDVMSKTSINLELNFDNHAIANMVDGNVKATFILAHDPIQGITVKQYAFQLMALGAHTSLTPPPAPGPHEYLIEQSTAIEALHDSNVSTQAPDNDPDETEDEDRSNVTAAALTARSAGDLPVSNPFLQTSDNDPNDEVKDNWLARGADAPPGATYSNQPHTVPKHPYAPTAPNVNTQGSRPHNQCASAGSSRVSGGRGGQKKRKRDEDAAPRRPTKAKKTKV